MVNWVEFGSGLVVLAIGVVLIVCRTKLARINADTLRSFWGGRGESAARRSTPTQAAVAGSVFIAFSVFLIVRAVFWN
jgi:hypothetical protein